MRNTNRFWRKKERKNLTNSEAFSLTSLPNVLVNEKRVSHNMVGHSIYNHNFYSSNSTGIMTGIVATM